MHIVEHNTHIRYFRGVEVRKVKRGETEHVSEHNTHIRYIRGIEVRKI